MSKTVKVFIIIIFVLVCVLTYVIQKFNGEMYSPREHYYGIVDSIEKEGDSPKNAKLIVKYRLYSDTGEEYLPESYVVCMELVSKYRIDELDDGTRGWNSGIDDKIWLKGKENTLTIEYDDDMFYNFEEFNSIYAIRIDDVAIGIFVD